MDEYIRDKMDGQREREREREKEKETDTYRQRQRINYIADSWTFSYHMTKGNIFICNNIIVFAKPAAHGPLPCL